VASHSGKAIWEFEMDLTGKVAFITGGGGGGGGGIGAGMADAFAEIGMRFVLADIDEKRASDEATRFGERALALELDVTSPDSWQAARTQAIDRFGQVDVLCNNAGVSIPWNTLIEVSPEEFDLALMVNLYGVFNGVKAFGPDIWSAANRDTLSTRRPSTG
jgi:NAD(P)-dependent dehydrogenase (short-subunit alcohol dehydrogenase family)